MTPLLYASRWKTFADARHASRPFAYCSECAPFFASPKHLRRSFESLYCHLHGIPQIFLHSTYFDERIILIFRRNIIWWCEILIISHSGYKIILFTAAVLITLPYVSCLSRSRKIVLHVPLPLILKIWLIEIHEYHNWSLTSSGGFLLQVCFTGFLLAYSGQVHAEGYDNAVMNMISTEWVLAQPHLNACRILTCLRSLHQLTRPFDVSR